MLANIKNYDNKIKGIETNLQATNTNLQATNTNLQTVNTKLTGDIQAVNTRVTDLNADFLEVSNLAYNHLCYTAVISIAQSSSYVFASPFLRAMVIGQINNFVHIIHVTREGVYGAAEGFKTEVNLMSVTSTANGITINNLNADNVLRVFILFK